MYIDSSLSIFTNESPYKGPFYYYVSEELLNFYHEDKPKNYIKSNFYDLDKYIKNGIFGNSTNKYYSIEAHYVKFVQYYSLLKRRNILKRFFYKIRRIIALHSPF